MELECSPPQLNGDGDLIHEEAEKAEMFNSSFQFSFYKNPNYQMTSTMSSKDRGVDI